jgi:hypothetical protein
MGSACTRQADCLSRFCAPTLAGGSVCALSCPADTLECYAGEGCLALGDVCGACLSAFSGAALGDPCARDDDCVSGICFTDGDVAACGSRCAYRYCSMLCGGAGECPAGMHCRGGLCVRGPASSPGETCVTDGDCLAGACIVIGEVSRCAAPCAPDSTCGEGFVCVDGSCWPGTIRPGDPCFAVGTSCTAGICSYVGGRAVCAALCDGSSDCPSGLSCVAVGDGLTGLCVPNGMAASLQGGGGAGCGCAAPGRSGGGGAAALLLWVGAALVLRRRSSGAR